MPHCPQRKALGNHLCSCHSQDLDDTLETTNHLDLSLGRTLIIINVWLQVITILLLFSTNKKRNRQRPYVSLVNTQTQYKFNHNTVGKICLINCLSHKIYIYAYTGLPSFVNGIIVPRHKNNSIYVKIIAQANFLSQNVQFFGRPFLGKRHIFLKYRY